MELTHIDLNEGYRDKNIMILSLNRGERLNAINDQLLMELDKALDYVAALSDINVLIINSEVIKSFCTGVDVSYVNGLSNREAADFFGELAKMLERLIHLPCVTIAVVNGYAHGGGADLALACDIRIGSTRSSFRFPGPQFGLLLGTQRLINELGPSRSRFLTLTNELIGADTASQFGLLHEVVEEESLLENALQRATKLARMPKYSRIRIKDLSNNLDNRQSSEELTMESVLDDDFKQRFTTYIENVKGK